ncbi:MAG: methyl-accepting chemotaxis protein [Rhodocyclaceae bacterium]
MKTLFKPATWLMCQMTYTYKFLILGTMALLTVSYLCYNLYDGLHQTVEHSNAKRGGNATVESISRLVQRMQQHRGLSAAVLNGNDGMREQRAAKEKEIGDSLNSVGKGLTQSLLASDTWKQIGGEWERLRSEGLQKTTAENFAVHTDLIYKILTFNIDIADETSLTFDPDVDTYYLVDTTLTKLPLAIERLGQLRARGTGILSQKQISEQQKIEISSQIAEVHYALRTLRMNLDKAARYNTESASSLRAAAEKFDTESTKVTQLVRDDIIGGVFATAPKDYFDLMTTVIDLGYKQAYDILQPTLRGLIDARAERAQKKLLATLSICLALLASIGYLSVGAYYSTIDNVNALAEGARRIASGDLTVRVELDTQDEHKDVARSFNELATNFTGLLRKVQQGSQQMLETSTRIAGSSLHISASTVRQSESASAMAATVEEMSVGIESISHNAHNAHNVSSDAGTLSARGGEIVATVIAGIERIADAVNQSSDVIGNLGEHSERISTIVGVIKEIADQTNLLALNAAIEAARAGESGRGFAVVADEVRKLAERTAKSTQEITEMIGAIQSGTQSAVTSMQNGVDRVNEGVHLARQAGDAMQQIQNGTREVADMVSDISSALHEQSVSSADIAKNVETIAQLSEENAAAVAENTSITERLEQLAAMLESEVRPYKIA